MLSLPNMRLVPRLLAGSGLVSVLLAAVAQAQPQPEATPPEAAPAAAPETAAAPAPSAPETLEPPYVDTPPPAPQAPVPAPAPQDTSTIKLKPQPETTPDTRPQLPIRAQRRVALLGEIGWNGLAGFGAIVTYHATPHISLDLGGGFSLTGWKGGVRGRYNFSTNNFTPFVGVGFNATSGLGQITSDPKDDPNAQPGEQPFTVDIGPSYFVSGVVGIELMHKRGFTMQGALGYARLLNKNVRLIDGSLTPDQHTGMNVAFKSGPVISIAFGRSFK